MPVYPINLFFKEERKLNFFACAHYLWIFSVCKLKYEVEKIKAKLFNYCSVK